MSAGKIVSELPLVNRGDRLFAASSRSASSKTIAGALPPSSMTDGFKCLPQTSAIFDPTGVDPVKLTFPITGDLILRGVVRQASDEMSE